ncbi:imelysin family protein [Portibacter marinus]|uniref:imelysin family protein n=1 Tax=Portibacter marinus TaxID=2898660 RepID=UPI001F234A42|nr:imelysin family protein [Portibacter marinus]
MLNRLLSLIFLITLFTGCEQSFIPETKDNFDRELMLENWVDLHIKPGYAQYLSALNELAIKNVDFKTAPSTSTLDALRNTYLQAYESWQMVALFEIGEAEKLGMRGYTNTYPTNIEKVKSNIEQQNINLALPSTRVAQGFPALDYMLFDKIKADELVEKLSANDCSAYLDLLISRLQKLATQVNDSWNVEERSSFVQNPESVDRMVNDFLFYYEKYLRAGKVGIPAGVFSGDPLPMNVEAPYSSKYSKNLLLTALNAAQAFFNADNSLADYLEFMDKGEIAIAINNHWEQAKRLLKDIDPSLKDQINENNLQLLEVYDELQKAVVLLKVDMLQALSIQVDYVDADGD